VHEVSEGRRRRNKKYLLIKPSQTQGLRAVAGDAVKAIATAVASPGTGHMSVTSLRRMMQPECPTPRNLAAPPPPIPRTSPLVQPTQWLNTTLRATGSGWLWKRRWPPCLHLEQTQTQFWVT